ncbi:hypothetical protein Sango_2908200 [Sesamum angolense]|uniref:Reverse transcriptase zinc-binding domain-containing protein n=1 Tax=Sesamum angolense TaxID=2727404 RepID=A0AAE1T583_9LAMI|nr:hypothetical protein Sango_2908200 [Sesamum angolense]
MVVHRTSGGITAPMTSVGKGCWSAELSGCVAECASRVPRVRASLDTMAVIEKIHHLCRAFLWNSKRAPVAWEDIFHPKEEGGLGIRHIQSWYVALLARVLWNIHCKADTLWAKWVNEIYLRGASLWDWQPKKGDSPLLRRLAEIRDRIITDFGSTDAAIRQMTEWTDSKGLVTSIAYEYFRPKLPKQPWKASIWKTFMPPKYSFILWLGQRERLATGDRLAFLHEDPTCSLCINSKESAKHLFFECPFSSYVWSHIQQWFGITRRMSTLLSAVKWLKKGKTGSSMQNKAWHLALACTVYSRWRHRNEIIFEGKAPNPDGLAAIAKGKKTKLLPETSNYKNSADSNDGKGTAGRPKHPQQNAAPSAEKMTVTANMPVTTTAHWQGTRNAYCKGWYP